MSNEEKRRRALSHLTTFRIAPDYLELYLYHIFEKDESFLTPDLIKPNGKPSKPAINNKTAELVVMLGMELIEAIGRDDVYE